MLRLGILPATCEHESSFPATGTLHIRSDGAKLPMAEPRDSATKEKPGGLAVVGVSCCSSKAELPEPCTAVHELRTHVVWGQRYATAVPLTQLLESYEEH